MNISSVQPIAFSDLTARSHAPEPAAHRTELIQAVKTVNDSSTLGENNELTFVVDRTTHRTLTRIIDRKTHEIVMQIPAEYVLRLAEQIKRESSS
jgi:uncharacterized FlaG/YvyC family protein